MRFVILYRNRQDIRDTIRDTIERWILAAMGKGMDFCAQPIRTSFFLTRLTWPDLAELYNFPVWMQVEEVEIIEQKLVSCRKVVVDVEMVATLLPESLLKTSE